jgi:hypothetical protein
MIHSWQCLESSTGQPLLEIGYLKEVVERISIYIARNTNPSMHQDYRCPCSWCITRNTDKQKGNASLSTKIMHQRTRLLMHHLD